MAEIKKPAPPINPSSAGGIAVVVSGPIAVKSDNPRVVVIRR